MSKSKVALWMGFLFILSFSPVLLHAQNPEIINGDTLNYTDNNGLKQGKWREVMGNVVLTGDYTNGERDGIWVTYHSNDMINKIENWKNGKKNGPSIVLDQRGSIVQEAEYRYDGYHGAYKEYVNGKVAKLITYKYGVQNGEFKMYYTNGKLQEESTYKDGVKDGASRWFTQEGNIVAEYHYKDGQLHGVQKTYFPGGQLMTEESYKDNVQEGAYIEYYENGKVHIQGTNTNGKQEGEWKEYDDAGKVVKTVKYKGGVPK
ncbi:MAG: toxin-antitoxin system YwqK family antitoxin [Bacteroidetes bacterium]|nr:toxin-antitoxin system YwqK family antitoxin [Bacteroidota bacterium]MBU1719401.1 toxin-antitoxin system YwqK family antitoxin [Bacteroidota bacterium]